MNQYVAGAILVLIIYAVICIPVGMLNVSLRRAALGAKPSPNEYLKAYSPFVNITYGRKVLYGKTAYSYGLYTVVLLLVFRVVAVLLVGTVPVLTIYSAFTTLAALALYCVLYIWNAASMCLLLRGGTMLTIVSVLIAPVGYYLISVRVPGYFKSVEDEVSGRFKSKN